MRGLLRIASQRSPYLRAGLAWPAREPIEVDIRDLDGERLRELVLDPVLSVQFGREGGFSAIAIDETMNAETFQQMIDAIATELPPRGEVAPAEVGDDLTGQLQRQAAHLLDLGDKLATVSGLALTNGFAQGGDLGDWLRERLNLISTLSSDITVLTNERDAAQRELSETKAELAEADGLLDDVRTIADAAGRPEDVKVRDFLKGQLDQLAETKAELLEAKAAGAGDGERRGAAPSPAAEPKAAKKPAGKA